jgi:hypothetical protein
MNKDENKKESEINHKLSTTEDLVTSVIIELESSHMRYLLVGMIVSFITSFALWHLFSFVCRRAKLNSSSKKTN